MKSESIIDRIRKKKQVQRELTAKEREEVSKKVLDAIRTTSVQREIYSMRAQDAIAKAKRAIATGDPTGKAIAMQELKMCYGVYRYMGTLNSAYRTLDAQIQMQNITQDFAQVVNSLSAINVQSPTVNFKELTRKALFGLKGLDLSGMENMVSELVAGTNVATSVGSVDDPFLEKLVSGEATLDGPYTEQVATAAAAPAQTVAQSKPQAVASATPSDDAFEALLTQLSDSLK